MSDRKRASEMIRRDSTLAASTIERIISDVPLDDVIAALGEMLSATTPQGNPDWRARENAIKLWLSYVVGLPVQRVETQQTSVQVQVDPAQVLGNQATLEAVCRKLRGTDAGRRLIEHLSSEPRQAKGEVVQVA